jgi:hypothetical protein
VYGWGFYTSEFRQAQQNLSKNATSWSQRATPMDYEQQKTKAATDYQGFS